MTQPRKNNIRSLTQSERSATSARRAKDLLFHDSGELAVVIFAPGGDYDHEDWTVVLNLGYGDEAICTTGGRDTAAGIALAIDAAVECGAYDEDGERL